MSRAFLTLFVLSACLPPETVVGTEGAPPGSPLLLDPDLGFTEMEGPLPRTIAVAQPGAAFAVTGVRPTATGDAPSTASARYDLSWEGEQLDGPVEVAAFLSGDQLRVGGLAYRTRVAEERVIGISLVVPASQVEPDARIPGTLSYFETPGDSDVLDVLLEAPVLVDVIDGVALAGDLVTLQVLDAPLAPRAQVGASLAGQLYEGPYDLEVDDAPQIDCGALDDAQRAFVSQTLAELAVETNHAPHPSYASIYRPAQGADPMQPFLLTSALVDLLASFDGTRLVERVPESGGLLELHFDAENELFGWNPRAGAGLYEVGRRLTIDARQWQPGFPVLVERFYAPTPDTLPERSGCVARTDAVMLPFTP